MQWQGAGDGLVRSMLVVGTFELAQHKEKVVLAVRCPCFACSTAAGVAPPLTCADDILGNRSVDGGGDEAPLGIGMASRMSSTLIAAPADPEIASEDDARAGQRGRAPGPSRDYPLVCG